MLSPVPKEATFDLALNCSGIRQNSFCLIDQRRISTRNLLHFQRDFTLAMVPPKALASGPSSLVRLQSLSIKLAIKLAQRRRP